MALLDHQKTRFIEKISRIRKGQYHLGDFIIADAKDVDLAGGITTMGQRRDVSGKIVGNRTRPEFQDQIRELIKQDVLDIMLASTSTIETLAQEGAFDGTRILPAFRGNEATDAWVGIRGGRYRETAPLPYRGAALDLASAPICLYSLTFVNDATHDVASLEAYARFRTEARQHGIMHFLEVFNPSVDTGLSAADTPWFINDSIIRLLASLTRAERPEFLKVAYNGPDALEELVSHDPSVVIGVLGGGQGTHRDTFELLAQTERHGGRLALFGRKINAAEHQPSIVSWMRRIVDHEATPEEAVRGYHNDLQRLGLQADRNLETDSQITEDTLRRDAR
ncbi:MULTISPECIES: hypothetical protein [Pseudomonas]|uniref:hypothetical protein n=1 Tax=Pseudomonas TaxID=286 RepID=UPI0015A7C5A0|nr:MULTISPECIES: hypothetical protein [Pseudomonas]